MSFPGKIETSPQEWCNRSIQDGYTILLRKAAPCMRSFDPTGPSKYKPWAWETSSPTDESSWPCWICHLLQEDPPWAPLLCLSMRITQHMASPTVSSVPFGEGQGWEDQPNGTSCPAGPAGCRQPTHWGWFCYTSSPCGGSVVKNLPAMQETWVGVENIPWRRKWQPKPTPVFLPGETHGQRSLAGSSP